MMHYRLILLISLVTVGLTPAALARNPADDAAARAFFARSPEVTGKETAPLSVVNATWRKVVGPGTSGAGPGYYFFDTDHLFELDLGSGAVRKFDLPVKRASTQIYEQGVCFARFGPDGRLYFSLYGGPPWWGRFDPATAKIQELGVLAGCEIMKWLWHHDGYIYIVTSPRMLGRIHIESGRCEDLGALGLADTETIGRTIGVDDDGWFHCEVGRVKRYSAFNVNTRIHLVLDEPWQPIVKPGPRPVPKGYVPVNAPESVSLYQVEEERPGSAKKLAGTGQFTVRYRRKDTNTWQRVTVPVTMVKRELATIGLGPDNRIYGCAGYLFWRYDPANGDMLRTSFCYNTYAYLPVGGFLYMQGYPNCRLTALDPARPITTDIIWHAKSPASGNPWEIENYSDVIPRKGVREQLWLKRGRQLALGHDGRIFTAGTGERYMSGGAIAWTDPATGITGVFRDPFEFLPVSALKSIDGGMRLAGCTWVAEHSGKPAPQPRAATVFLFDAVTTNLVFHVPVSGCNAVQDLIVARPDTWIGLGLRNTGSKDGDPYLQKSVVFFFDPEQRKVTRQIDLPFSLARRTGRALIAGTDGQIWAAARYANTEGSLMVSETDDTSFGGIVRIDPVSRTVEPVFRIGSPGNFIFVGTTMYLCGAPGLRIVDVSDFL